MPFLSERVFDANMQDIYRPHLQWIAQQTDEARDQLIRLANINSGSLHARGVRRMAEAVRDLFAPLQADAEIIDVPPFQATAGDGQLRNAELGPALRLRHRPEAPLQVFLGGHLDTVFPKESSFQQVRQSAEDELHGPGVADLKGGILVAYNALRALERSPWADQIGWQVVLNPDEEIGSASSMPILLESAAQCDLGLVYEPSFPDGNLAGARKGSGNFDVIVRGRAAHAGREHHLGRNAIRACADFISALDALNGQRDGVTINPGFVRGGGALNVVRHAVELHVRADSIPEQLDADLTGLDIGDNVKISDIKLPEGAEPTITDRDFTIATITGRMAEVVEETEEGAEADEVEAINQSDEDEGEGEGDAEGEDESKE